MLRTDTPTYRPTFQSSFIRIVAIVAIILFPGLAPAVAQSSKTGERELAVTPEANVSGTVEQVTTSRPQTSVTSDVQPLTKELGLKSFEYAVKFVCGKPDAPVVAPGEYFTAINVHNPSYRPVTFRKKVAVALPGERPGPISQFFEAHLNPDQAFEVDCPDILRHANHQGFLKGFVVIQTPSELDVVAVYTAGHPLVETLEVKRVEPRPIVGALPVPPNQTSGCGDPASGVGCCCNEPKPGGGMFPDCKAPLVCVRDPNLNYSVCATHVSLNLFLDPVPAVAAGEPKNCGQP